VGWPVGGLLLPDGSKSIISELGNLDTLSLKYARAWHALQILSILTRSTNGSGIFLLQLVDGWRGYLLLHMVVLRGK
jgi:hypothetical protein